MKNEGNQWHRKWTSKMKKTLIIIILGSALISTGALASVVGAQQQLCPPLSSVTQPGTNLWIAPNSVWTEASAHAKPSLAAKLIVTLSEFKNGRYHQATCQYVDSNQSGNFTIAQTTLNRSYNYNHANFNWHATNNSQATQNHARCESMNGQPQQCAFNSVSA